MAGSKRDHQRRRRQQQLRLAAEQRRRDSRRRKIRFAAIAAIVVLAVSIIVAIGVGGGSTGKVAVNASSTTTPTSAPATTVAALTSAAGKPCVAVADPLPAGAPAVPVQVGPPPTKLVTQDLKVGTGATVTATDTLTVNYIGVSCSTGKIFDSSYSRGQPATFALSGVIKGWQDGIPGMKVGGERLLGIPAVEAYGSQGSAPVIAPDEFLWFVVSIVDAKAA